MHLDRPMDSDAVYLKHFWQLVRLLETGIMCWKPESRTDCPLFLSRAGPKRRCGSLFLKHSQSEAFLGNLVGMCGHRETSETKVNRRLRNIANVNSLLEAKVSHD